MSTSSPVRERRAALYPCPALGYSSVLVAFAALLFVSSPVCAGDSEAGAKGHVAEELTKRTYACAVAKGQQRIWCGTSFGLVPRPLSMPQEAPANSELPGAALSAGAVLLPDSVVSVVIAEDQLFAAAGGAGLQTYSLAGAGEAAKVSEWSAPGNVVGVDVDRAHVFASLGAGGWAVLARTRGGGLRELSRIETQGYVRQVLPLTVPGDALVAVAEGSAGLSLWRVRDPRRPERVVALDDLGGEVRHMALHEAEPLLALATGRAGLAVVRMGFGPKPKLVLSAAKETQDMTHGVSWAGGHLLAAAGSAGLLHSNARLDPLRGRKLEGSANKVFTHQGQVYVAIDHAGLASLPLRDVTAP